MTKPEVQHIDLGTLRKLSFVQDVQRIRAETGLSERKCFDRYEREFPTFGSYDNFKKWKRRNCPQMSPRDPISVEISNTFQKLERGIEKASRFTTAPPDDRDETKRLVDDLETAILADPAFRNRLLTQYLQMTARNE